MITMTPERWADTGRYIGSLFATEDAHQAGLMERAVKAGLPDIDVGAAGGKLLHMLVRMTGGRRVVEVGTLAGYSAIWMARALAPGGRLVTIELSELHAKFARAELERAGVGDRVDVRLGRGAEVLARLVGELGEGSVDMVFLDAERSEYIPMLGDVRRLLRVGGVLAIDNALNAKRWTADPYAPGEEADMMDTVNRRVAMDGSFSGMILPVDNGVLVGVRC